jgi:hypothetical protein
MVEVFKTNVEDCDQSKILVELIHSSFADYKANFDLMDCDNILRIQSTNCEVQSHLLIRFLQEQGVEAVVLPDEIIPPIQTALYNHPD